MFLRSLLLGWKRKVWEPIMILLTVAIAVATFVSALTLRTSVRETADASYRAFSGECELEATLSEEYSTYYLTSDNAVYLSLESEAAKYGRLYAGYSFYASVGSGSVFAEIYATEIDRLQSYNSIDLVSGSVTATRTGVILSEPFAEKIGAMTGDYLSVTRYASDQRLTVVVSGIARAKGVFRQADVLLSPEGASRLLSLGDNVRVYNRFFIDISDEKTSLLGIDEAEVTQRIGAACPLFEVASPVADHDVEITLSYQSTLLFVIAVIVAVLGVILIYTAVTLVMKNRVSLAALFKSVGATNGALTLYLLAEIAMYGLIGSLLGLAASLGVSALFGALTGTIVTFSVGWLSAILGVLFGLALALLSALIPVLRLSYAPLYDMLHEASPVLSVPVLPAVISGAIFLALFLWTALATVSSAFVVGIFAFLALLAALFTVTPLAIKGISVLILRLTRDKPRAGKLYLAASSTKYDRHVHSGARLLAIVIMAVLSVGMLLGESHRQLAAFNDLFRTEIVISADSADLPGIASEVSGVESVSAGYLAYIAQRCEIEGEKGNTVTLLAAHGEEYDDVFRAEEFGVDVASFVGSKERRAAIGGGLALKLGLSVGDTFALIVDGKRMEFVIASTIDTPLTVVFTDLLGLGISPNVCLAKGSEDGRNRLAEKYALEAAVYSTSDAFGYVTELAVAYMKVFTLFEIVICLFALAGYLNTRIAAYRDKKRERELLLSAGADRGDLRRILVWQNALVIVTAAALGVLCSFALLYVVQNMLKTLGLYFTLLG